MLMTVCHLGLVLSSVPIMRLSIRFRDLGTPLDQQTEQPAIGSRIPGSHAEFRKVTTLACLNVFVARPVEFGSADEQSPPGMSRQLAQFGTTNGRTGEY